QRVVGGRHQHARLRDRQLPVDLHRGGTGDPHHLSDRRGVTPTAPGPSWLGAVASRGGIGSLTSPPIGGCLVLRSSEVNRIPISEYSIRDYRSKVDDRSPRHAFLAATSDRMLQVNLWKKFRPD